MQENFGCCYARFAKQSQLERFCWYIDSDTRPDFDDEVPQAELDLFERVEVMELPEDKALGEPHAVFYDFAMMPEPDDDYHALASVAERLGAECLVIYWFGEYGENSLRVTHKGQTHYYNKDDQPFAQDVDFDGLSCREVVELVVGRL